MREEDSFSISSNFVRVQGDLLRKKDIEAVSEVTVGRYADHVQYYSFKVQLKGTIWKYSNLFDLITKVHSDLLEALDPKPAAIDQRESVIFRCSHGRDILPDKVNP